MTTWNFDEVSNTWNGGHLPAKCGGKIKFIMKNLKTQKKLEIRVFDVTSPNKKKTVLQQENIWSSDYKTDQEFMAIVDKKKHEIYNQFSLSLNTYRSVVYKGEKAIEVKLPRGLSMLVESADLDKITPYIWNVTVVNKGKQYHVGRALPGRKRQYLSKYLYGYIGDIIQFKDGNTLNFLRSNIIDSGKEQTYVSTDIIIKNKAIYDKFMTNLNQQRNKHRQKYDCNDNFILDKIISNWYCGHIRSTIHTNRDNIIVKLIDRSGKKLSTKKFPFTNTVGNTKYDVLVKAEKYKEGMCLKYMNKLVINPYRYVVFNNQKCIEMKLTKGKAVIFDEHNLAKVTSFKWCANPAGNLWRAMRHCDNKYMHRILTNNKWKKVDHIDGCELNNLESNLRDGTHINQLNQKLNKNNTTGINGISWDPAQQRYRYRWFKDNVEHMKAFPAQIWKSEENALAAAVAFKVGKDKEHGNNNGIRPQ